MLTGEGRAGKTSMMRSLLRLDFNPNELSTNLASTEVCTVDRTAAINWRQLELGLLGLEDEHTRAIALSLQELELSDEARALFANSESSSQLGQAIARRLAKADGATIKEAVAAAISEALERQAARAADATKPESVAAKPQPSTAAVGAAAAHQQATHTGAEAAKPKPAHKPAHKPEEAAARHLDMDKVQSLLINGVKEEVRLIIYDLGGQRVFYALHHLFLTRSAVYFVVFDMRKLVDTGATELVDEMDPSKGTRPVMDVSGRTRAVHASPGHRPPSHVLC